MEPTAKELRAFAAANNIPVNSRGIIGRNHPVREAYAKALAQPAKKAAKKAAPAAPVAEAATSKGRPRGRRPAAA